MRTAALRIALILLLVVVVAAGAGFWMLRQHGLVSDRPPGRVETAIARRLVVLSIPASARARGNPHAGDATAERDGGSRFQEHCAVCHGTDGRGTLTGHRMFPPVPDLADPGIQAMSDGALFAVIQHGVRWTGMPAFRQSQTEDDTWKLVAFIRSIPSAKAAAVAPDAQAAHARHPDGASVSMDGTAFTPPAITVTVGDRVTWTNKDPFPHNVTSAAGRFHSEDLEPGGEWTLTAERAGRFEYVCTLHPGMRGTLTVEERRPR
jgi:plastocyanin